jgi:linearmycin/streptolysin S transport system permease protein
VTSLRALGWIALKDLRRLSRRRVDAFFVFLFPVVYAAFFTQVVSGSAAGASRIRLAVVDEDQSQLSRDLVASLERETGLRVTLLGKEEALERVRQGRFAAYLLIPSGAGQEQRPRVTLALDPARQGEAGLLRGVLLRCGGELLGERLQARVAEVKAQLGQRGPPGSSPQLDWEALGGEPLGVEEVEVSGGGDRPPVPAAVTLPQGTIWALLACAAAFGASLVGERTGGTLRRLQVAPVGVLPVLLGKGLACFITILTVCAILLGAVAPLFGVEIARYDLLALAVVSSGVCFVGLMLLIGTIGSSEDSAYRIGWAIVLVLAMLGGAMVPTYLMPGWMEGLSWVSPVRWTLHALEGAIWRGFSLRELALPCVVLVGEGVVAFGLGTLLLKLRLARGWGS